MRAHAFAILMALATAACPSKPGPSAEPPTGDPETAVTDEPTTTDEPTGETAPGGTDMSEGFQAAMTAFRTHAAGKLGVAADAVKVTPAQEEIAKVLADARLGALWRFDGTSGPLLTDLVRGWAAPDGTIVTPQQNLSRFFTEAGVWSGNAPAADQLARQLAWAMPGHQPQLGARLELAEGAGTLTFTTVYVEGPAGGHPGPEQRFEHVVTLGADQTATLETTRRGP